MLRPLGGKGGVAIGKGANRNTENNNITNTPPQDTFTKDADAVLVKPNEGAEDGLDVTLLTVCRSLLTIISGQMLATTTSAMSAERPAATTGRTTATGTHKCDECGANENHTWIDNKRRYPYLHWLRHH